MRTLKTLALAATAAISVASTASAQSYAPQGYTGYNAPAVQTYYAPGTGYTGYTPTNVDYHGQGHGNGYGNQGGYAPAVTYYRVHGVHHHDHLNVRHGPGVRNHVVYTLPYNAYNIQVGQCAQISTSHGPATWCTVAYQGHARGWVNARYLAQQH